jgi:hypothetical protein
VEFELSNIRSEKEIKEALLRFQAEIDRVHGWVSDLEQELKEQHLKDILPQTILRMKILKDKLSEIKHDNTEPTKITQGNVVLSDTMNRKADESAAFPYREKDSPGWESIIRPWKLGPLEHRPKAGGYAELVIHRGNAERLLDLPDGLVEVERRAKPGCLYVEYLIHHLGGARFVYWNRGYGCDKLSRIQAADFKALLDGEPHILTAEEKRKVTAVLGNGVMKNEGCFEVVPGGLRTEALADGSTVLVLEADWREHLERSLGIFADFDGTGQYVEQVYLIALVRDFEKLLSSCRSALSSLRWSHPG